MGEFHRVRLTNNNEEVRKEEPRVLLAFLPTKEEVLEELEERLP